MTHKKYKDRSYLLFPFFGFILLMSAMVLLLSQSSQKQNIQSKAQVEQSTPGQIISLDFKISGIGSASGNLDPLHKSRPVTLYFYDPDKNTSDLSVKPLAKFLTSVKYDSDVNSTSFGSFINSNVDLTDKIPDGN